ncbi:MAG: RNA polymerase sigma-70 factor [Tannerellaceae bacterium]|nr:RNA polymerase sigma-70 factor [Tannerellaceae bacterium]
MENSPELLLFNQLVSAYQVQFIRFANKYVADLSVAEDFTMEAFMLFWENRHTLQEDSNIPAYILTIIKNKCLNYLSHLQVREQVNDKLKELADWELQTRISTLEVFEPYEVFTKEVQQIIRETLAALPEKTRNIFVMSRYENKTHKEIAAEVGITTKAVEFHVAKVLKILRHNMKDYLPAFALFFL